MSQFQESASDDYRGTLSEIAYQRPKVREEMPQATEEVVNTVVLAWRPLDLRTETRSDRENAGLIWTVLGGRYLRVHEGFLYALHGGAFQQIAEGALPEEVHAALERALQALVGFFFLRGESNAQKGGSRGIVAPIPRRIDALLFRATSVFRLFSIEDLMQIAVDVSSRDGRVKEVHWADRQGPWAGKAGMSLVKLLSSDDFRSILVSWYNTPKPMGAGALTYENACLDTSVSPPRWVDISPGNDSYVRIPISILPDPFLDSAGQHLLSILNTHHWGAPGEMFAMLAAEVLAMMGRNAKVMLFAYDDGGRGKSVRSAIRHSAFGPSAHAYVDAAVFFQSEELRKSGASKSSRSFWTLQEMVSGGQQSSFMSHLFRKFCTAEVIECRPPYAKRNVDARMIGAQLWEVNSPPQRNATFESMFRRCIVLQTKSTFVEDPKLACPERGIFLASNDPERFAVTTQCGAAMHQFFYHPLMHAHRPEELLHMLSGGGAAIDEQHGGDIFKNPVAFARVMRQIPEEYNFPDARFNVVSDAPPTERPTTEDTCARAKAAAKGAVALARFAGRLYYSKLNMAERQFFGKIPPARAFFKVEFSGVTTGPPPRKRLECRYDEKPCPEALRRLQEDGIRLRNARVIHKALSQGGAGGKRQGFPGDLGTRGGFPETKADRVLRREEDLSGLFGLSPGGFVTTYRHSSNAAPDMPRSRRYAMNPGAQRISGYARAILYPNCVDVDVVNCFFSLARHFVERTRPARCGVLGAGGKLPFVEKVLTDFGSFEEVLKSNGVADPKLEALKAFNGGNHFPDAAGILQGIRTEGAFLRWRAASLYPSSLEYFASSADSREFPDATLLSYLLQGQQD